MGVGHRWTRCDELGTRDPLSRPQTTVIRTGKDLIKWVSQSESEGRFGNRVRLHTEERDGGTTPSRGPDTVGKL